MTDHSSRRLPMAIVAAALIVAAGLIFLGYQIRLDKTGYWTEPQITALIDQRLAEQGGSGSLSDEQFQARVEEGIKAFIEKQREAQASGSQGKAEKLPPVDRENDHIRGNADARITLVEYSDFECPYCKRFHGTPQQLMEAYDGQVNWVYRHFPLGFHNPGAQKQAEASECVAEQGGNGAFWRFTDAIYERTESGGNGFPLDDLAPLAGEVGVDTAEFQKCLDSGRYTEHVKTQMSGGQAAGVTGTPGNFFVDHATGRVVAVSGARPLGDLKQVVDRLLEQPATDQQ